MTITFHVSSEDQLLIKSGQEVDFKTPLAKQVFTQDVKIELAAKFGIPPQNIFIHLTKVVGDEVEKGEVLAKKKTMMSEKNYTSEYSGVVKEINSDEGSLLISTKAKKEKTRLAYFKGEVESVKKNEVTLKVKKEKVYPAKEVTDDFGGGVLFAKNGAIDRFDEEEVEGKVLFVDSVHSYNKVKFEVMGILGFVTLDVVSADSNVPHATLKSSDDLEEIKALKYPYCLVSKKNNSIYLYQ